MEFCALSYTYAVLSDEDHSRDEKLVSLVKAICGYSDEFSASTSN